MEVSERSKSGTKGAHLDEILRQTGCLETLLNTLGNERSLWRGLEDDRVAGDEGGDEGVDLDHVCKREGSAPARKANLRETSRAQGNCGSISDEEGVVSQ